MKLSLGFNSLRLSLSIFQYFLTSLEAFVVGFKRATALRATDEGSLPEIAQYSPYYMYLPLNVFTASKVSNLYILFAVTAAGVVPCCGRKKSPRIHHP